MRNTFATVCTIIAAISISACAMPARAQLGADAKTSAPAKIFNLRDFGAVGDGAAKDTAALQKALDVRAVSGGGEVRVPAGNYLIGSVQIGAATTLRFEKDAILTGSPDADDYPMIDVRWEGRWQPGRRGLIYAADSDNVAIVGPGTINGNADVAAPQNPRGAVVVEFVHCKGVVWDGFSVNQGGNWATHPTMCDDVKITNLTIRGRRDGIDVDSCKDVLIENCDIENGDDCISLKSGRGLNGARLGKPVENVTIRNCRMVGGRFACIGIGSEISGGVRNIRIENCKMTARTHCIYVKTRIGRAGVAENISGDNLDILGGGFLRINLTRGGNTNTADDPVEGYPGNPLLGYPSASNFSFSNVRLTDAAVVLEANEVSPEMPIDGLSLKNVSGTAKKGIAIRHAKNVSIENINVTGVEGPLLGIEDATGTGLEGAAKLDPLPAQTQRSAGGNAPGANATANANAGAAAAPDSKRIMLWNGRDLEGWDFFTEDKTVKAESVWSVKEGALHLDCKTPAYIRTRESYKNYTLHVEWRWLPGAPANSNSGVMVHTHGPDAIWPLCFECQLKNANAGQVVGMGLDIPDAPMLNNRKRSPRLKDPSEKPVGEWNSYDITCKDATIEARVNGVKQNAVDKLPVSEGAIALQMEGYPIEFRNVWLERIGN